MLVYCDSPTLHIKVISTHHSKLHVILCSLASSDFIDVGICCIGLLVVSPGLPSWTCNVE